MAWIQLDCPSGLLVRMALGKDLQPRQAAPIGKAQV